MNRLFLLLCMLLPVMASGQYVYYRQFSHSSGELIHDIESSLDGGMYILFQKGNATKAIAKVNNLGVVQWSKSISGNSYRGKLEVAADTTVIAAVGTAVHKLRPNGNVIWSRTMTRPILEMDQAPSGGRIFLLADSSTSSTSHNTIYACMDSSGNVLWSRKLANAEPNGVAARKSGGCYVTCSAYSGQSNFNDGYLLRVDANGMPVWERRQSGGITRLPCVVETVDQRVIVVGNDQGTYINTTAYCLDSNGTHHWGRLDGHVRARFDYVRAIVATPDSGAAIIGESSDGPLFFYRDEYARWYKSDGRQISWKNMSYGFYGTQMPQGFLSITALTDGSVAYSVQELGYSGIPGELKSWYGNLRTTGAGCKVREPLSPISPSANGWILMPPTLTAPTLFQATPSVVVASPLVQTDSLICLTCVLPASAAYSYNSIGFTTTFTNQSTQATSYKWAFGDGTFSTQANPNHTYLAYGSYNVCLTAYGVCDSSVTCQTVSFCPTIAAGYSYSVNQYTANFTNTSTGTPTSYSWTFGDGGTSTVANPSHNYPANGTYTSCLTITNACTTSTACQTITICNPPNAAFNSNSNLLNVNFTNASTNQPSSYNWTFGDGGTSTQVNPSHSYTSPGTYNVCLITTNSCGADTICHTVTVCAALNAAFASATTNLTALFSNSSSGATNYAWTFGDGGTSTLANPSHAYSSPGTYTVCLIASNACGSDTTCSNVTLCAPLSAAFSSTTNGFNATFNNSSTGATSYSWTFGDGGTSSLASPNHSYASPGVYNVCLVAANSCTNSTTCHTVTICAALTAGFSSSSSGLTGIFTNSSGGANSYSWDFGDGGGSTLANPFHTYAAPGTYNVCLTATNACGSTTTCHTITVCQALNAGFTMGQNGLNVTFSNTSTGANSYSWDFGDGGSSTLIHPTHTYSSPGTYLVCMTATNGCGAITTCQSLTICAPLAAAFGQSSLGLATYFTNGSTGANSYSWTFGDGGSSTQTDPIHNYAAPGTYTVCLMAINACDTATTCTTITVCAAVVASFSYSMNGLSTSFNNTSSGATTYLWNFGDGGGSVLPHPTHVYFVGGVYTVCLVASNACGSDTSCAAIGVVGANASSQPGLIVWPNPANDEARLRFSSLEASKYEIVITDMQGHHIKTLQGETSSGDNEIALDVRAIPAGAYVVELRAGTLSANRILVLQ